MPVGAAGADNRYPDGVSEHWTTGAAPLRRWTKESRYDTYNESQDEVVLQLIRDEIQRRNGVGSWGPRGHPAAPLSSTAPPTDAKIEESRLLNQELRSHMVEPGWLPYVSESDDDDSEDNDIADGRLVEYHINVLPVKDAIVIPGTLVPRLVIRTGGVEWRVVITPDTRLAVQGEF